MIKSTITKVHDRHAIKSRAAKLKSFPALSLLVAYPPPVRLLGAQHKALGKD